MKADTFWQVFLETGAPEAYLLYQKARRMEEHHVYNGPGTGASGNGLQGA